MVDLPSISNVVPQLHAPQSRVSPGQIAQPYAEMAANLDKTAGKLNEASVELAKTAGLKAVTRDADGNIQIDTPPVVGDAAIAFQQAVKTAAVADGEGVLKRDDIALRQEHRDDPNGYVKAAEAYKKEKIQQYTDAAGADVGITLGKIIDGQTTLTYRGLLNEHERLTMQRADASITAGMTSATDDMTAMARGGISSGAAWDAAKDKYNTLQQQKLDNPRLAYPPEQAAFEKQQLEGVLKANGFLYHIDQVYKDSSGAGGPKQALLEAESIRTDTSIKLSGAQREAFYHKAVGEIRANEAIRKQDIGEAHLAFRELRTAAQLGQRIDPSEVESVRQAYRAAGYPAGIAMVDAAFAHKDLHDDFGRRPLSDQTSELYTIRGAAASKAAYQFFREKGYRGEEAAGIVGNLAHESGLNPLAVGDNGTSAGLAQFHNERLSALRDYAKSVGKPATDFQTQLEFIDRELNTTEGATRARLAGAKTPEEAAAAFIHYERPQGYTPDNPAGGLGYERRQALARSVFTGGAADQSGGPGVSSWLIANRADTLNDAATKAWKEVWTDWSGGKGGMPPVAKIEQILNAARATGNIDLQNKIAHDADLMDRVERISQLPLPDQHTLEGELQRRIRQGVSETGDELVFKQLQARSAAITKGLDDNPISTTIANFGDKFKGVPALDFSNDQALATGLKVRGQIAQFAQANWQTPGALSALDAADVGQVQGMLANPDPAVKGKVFNALSSLPEEVRNATLMKIGKDRPELMVSVAAGSMMKSAPDVASSIIRGQAAIAVDKGFAPAKGAEATAFDQEFDKRVPASTFSLAARANASGPYAVAQGMVKARYADLSAQSADTSGKLNTDRLTQAVNDVTGGILDHNGGKLIAPARGMPQATFDKVMYGIGDADLGHGPMPSNLGAADAAMKLTPQEQALYQRHFTNLTGTGGVTNANGSRSTLFVNTFGVGDKTVVVPSVWDGKILTPDESLARAKAEGLDKFPTYASAAEANARYGKMHDFMEKDTAQYNRGNPAAVTTLNGEPVTANYLRNAATLESAGDGRYYVKLGRDPMKPVYAYQDANTEAPRKFMLDLRNRPLGAVPPATQIAMP